VERERRLHHSDVPGTGATVRLDPEETHHALRVLRLRPGDAVSVFDGKGHEWSAMLMDADRHAAAVRIEEERTGKTDPELRVILHQGLCRPEKIEWIIQKGTEIGIAAFHLLASERTAVHHPSAERLKRWRRIALEACKQSGRNCVPEIVPAEGSRLSLDADAAGLLLDPREDSPPIRSLLGRPAPRVAHLAVGPEGGFSVEEIEQLEARGWFRARVGPRVLRTETAGIVAAVLVLHAWGDL
jgi:16S rRNA (uracil1498-N3)-methyltransferase